MKVMKKLAVCFLAVVMMMTFCVATAFAEDPTYSITIDTEGKTTHEYFVYQIFTGDLHEGVLSNVKYGENYHPNTDAGKSVSEADLEAIGNDADVFAKQIIANGTLTGEPVATLDSSNDYTTGKSLAAGYYLIVDNTEKQISDGDAYSAYIVQVVEDVNMTPKAEAPTLEKEIVDGDTEKNDDAAIGDEISFKLTGTVPAKAVDYDYYYYIIGDTLSEGLTFTENTANIVVSASTKGQLTKDTDYKVYTGTNAEDYTFQIALLNAKALAGQTITVEYKATLNEKAKIGDVGNDNKAKIIYSNDPNTKYDGTEDSNKPGKPDDKDIIPLGETPESWTETYTTGIQLQKVDENGNILTGAEFQITGENLNIVLVSEAKFDPDSNGDYYGLKNGTYTKEEPIMEDRYERAPDDATAGYVKVGDNDYREATQDDIESGAELYIKIPANLDKYEIGNDNNPVKYARTVTNTVKTVKGDEAVDIKAFVDNAGIVTFEGLSAGKYTIEETTTPAGYNTISNITLNVSFNPTAAEGESKWSATAKTNTTETLTLNSDGVFELTVVNKKGIELPETGGMGTTMFYVIGGILVVVAAILLITKKRMGGRK